MLLSFAIAEQHSLSKILSDAIANSNKEENEWVSMLKDADLADSGATVARWVASKVGKGYSQNQCTGRKGECCRLGPNCYDCSGLVYMGWKQVGVTIPTWTGAYPGNMKRVSPSNIRAGDVLWRTGHVGMYVGGGVVVHAANSRVGVIKQSLSSFTYTYIYRP